jgi:hypothetical protein
MVLNFSTYGSSVSNFSLRAVASSSSIPTGSRCVVLPAFNIIGSKLDQVSVLLSSSVEGIVKSSTNLGVSLVASFSSSSGISNNPLGTMAVAWKIRAS